MNKLFSLLLFMSPYTLAADITYHLKHPESAKLFITTCDNYIRDESKIFINDMTSILKSHNERKWDTTISLLNKYTGNSDSTHFIKRKNQFLTSLLDCGSFYTFNTQINYFDKVRMHTALYLASIKNYTEKNEVHTDRIKPIYDNIITNINILSASKKVSANKKVKRDK